MSGNEKTETAMHERGGDEPNKMQNLLEAMEQDAVFAKEIVALIQKEDTGAIAAVAANRGIAVSESDIMAYLDFSKNLDIGGLKKGELSEKDLENVAGGSSGSISDPHLSGCWYFEQGEAEFKDGQMRRKCQQLACKMLNLADFRWYICRCWGTDRCVNSWHIDVIDCK